MGRRKLDSVELENKPADSHVARTDQDEYGKIFRRNMPYGNVGDHGTVFVGFSADQKRLARMLESMAGLIDGTVVDGTSPGLPASFKVNQVVPGWTVQPVYTYIWHPSGIGIRYSDAQVVGVLHAASERFEPAGTKRRKSRASIAPVKPVKPDVKDKKAPPIPREE